MEFLEENSFAHLLSLIKIEMNPLRRRSLPLPERRVESSCSLKGTLCLSDLPRQGTPFKPLPEASPSAFASGSRGISFLLQVAEQQGLVGEVLGIRQGSFLDPAGSPSSSHLLPRSLSIAELLGKSPPHEGNWSVLGPSVLSPHLGNLTLAKLRDLAWSLACC